MWDVWRDIHCARVSPEAACMIATQKGEDRTPGGAGNALLCMYGLNRNVMNCTSLDLDFCPNPLSTDNVCSKIRLMSGNQQIIRIDEDVVLPLAEANELLDAVCSLGDAETSLLIADYGKGVVDLGHMATVARRRWQAVVWDPYPSTIEAVARSGAWHEFLPEDTFVKCNLKEAKAGGIVAEASNNLEEVIDDLSDCDLSRHLNFVVTCGAQGSAAIIDSEVWRFDAYPTVPTNPIGAGDAFAVGLLHALSLGCRQEQAVAIGQFIAHVCVQMPRCGQPTLTDVAAYYDWLAHYVDVEEAISGVRVA